MTKRPDNTLKLIGQPDETEVAIVARAAIGPYLASATVVAEFEKRTFGSLDLTATVDELVASANTINPGDLKKAEAMLMSQASALNWPCVHRQTWHKGNISKRAPGSWAWPSKRKANAGRHWRRWPTSRTRRLYLLAKPTLHTGRNRLIIPSRHRPRARLRAKPEISRTNYWKPSMTNGWTLERRARQAAAIQNWKPWQRSTGPRTPDGRARSSRNAYRGGWRQELRQLSRDLRDVLARQVDAAGLS
jgi:hypothetical protein